MKLIFIFIIISYMNAINFAYVNLDTTTDIPLKFPKNSKTINFIKVDLDRDETFNEKKLDAKSSTTQQPTTKAADLMPTKTSTTTSKAHFLDDDSTENYKDIISTTEKISITTVSVSSSQEAKNNDSGNKTRWFFVGACVGIVISLIINYIYNFHKARSQSSYHDL